MRRIGLILLSLSLLLCPSSPRAAEAASPTFRLADANAEFPVDFSKYGEFFNLGGNKYKYRITNRAGLAKAMGEGLYPNATLLYRDPAFIKWKAAHSSEMNQWDYVDSGDPQTDFYVWAQAKDVGPGAKLFFSGKALAQAGYVKAALKAFHGVLVFFPREAVWSADHTFVWYVANEALGQIDALVADHPEVGVQLIGTRFKIINGGDTDLSNDEFVINPGHWEKPIVGKPVDLKTLKIIARRGYGKVRLVQYENKQWQLLVDKKPFVVQGITYNPTPVGKDLSATAGHWMFEDANDNGEPDYPYETWVDLNRNNRQDENEPAVGDFELMRRMGVNAIRLYRPSDRMDYEPQLINKKLLRELHDRYGISVILGDLLGAYTVGSGANWEEGTDYTDPTQLENMRKCLKDFVNDQKDEPYVLMWILGNENMMNADYSGVNATRTKAASQVKEYLSFVNEMAEMIHKLDPDHPVAVGNLDLINVDEHTQYAPAVDIFGTNLYRGAGGFGVTWRTVQEAFDRPVLITEYGCDAWDTRKDQEDQKAQADYHAGNWKDIQRHLAGTGTEGNAIGGVVFEYTDEWWKSHGGSWDAHDTGKDNPMAFPDGWANEEWFGVLSLGDGSDNLMRQKRLVYEEYRDKLWVPSEEGGSSAPIPPPSKLKETPAPDSSGSVPSSKKHKKHRTR
jgi:beta-glucuronidase